MRFWDGAQRLFRRGSAVVLLGTLLLAGRATPVQAWPTTLSAVVPPHVEGKGFTSRPRLVGSLTARDAVAIALAQSLRVGLAREEALMATAERLMASSGLGLKVSATAMGAVANTSMIYTTAPGVMPVFYAQLADRNVADFNLMAMLPLFTGGRLQALLIGARTTEKAALARQAWMLLDVAREARAAYARVLLSRQKLDVALWDVAEQTENLRLVTLRFTAGRIARYEVLRARAELANSRQMENDAGAALEVDQAALKSVLGVDMASALDFVDVPAMPPPGAALAVEMQRALSGRPDLIAAHFDVDAAAQAIRAARAQYSPQVYAVGMLEEMFATGRGHPGSSSGGYSVGAVASLPILDAGERRADVLRTEAQRRHRALEVQSLELEVTRQVVEATVNLNAARQNVALAEDEVERGEEDLRVARLRFVSGRALHIEVIDALRTVARARLNRVNALYLAAVARADLLRATGRLNEE